MIDDKLQQSWSTLHSHSIDLKFPVLDQSGSSQARSHLRPHYPGRPHGLTATHQDEVNADLLKFVTSVQQTRKAAA